MRASSFEEALLSSIESALMAVFGLNTAKAVDFYVDKHIALKNPSDYSRSIQKLFGDGAKVLMEKIIEGVSKEAGLESSAFSTLEECVRAARTKLQSRPD